MTISAVIQVRKIIFCVFKFIVCLGFLSSAWGRTGMDPEWQLLTQKNFSTQIHHHEFVLVMVTIPWSGEARALRNDLVQLLKYTGAQFGSLRLMLIYRNIEKHVGDVLNGNGAVNFVFYRQAVPYKYHGKLSAQNILASVWYAMTIPSDDLPFKQLDTLEDVDSFLESTDKAVILFDTCGWAQNVEFGNRKKSRFSSNTKVIHKISNQENSLGREDNTSVSKNPAHASQLNFKGDDSIQSLRVDDRQDENTQTSKSVRMMVKEHGFLSEKETSEIFEGSYSIPSNDGSHFSSYINDSRGTEASTNALLGMNESNHSLHEHKDILFYGTSCNSDEYDYFVILYSNLSSLARDNMLPPERQKFGLIINKTVISSFSLPVQDSSSIMLLFPDCPKCSKTFHRGNNLEEFLFTSHPFVTELKGEGYNLIPSLSTESPSLILFIDRASPSEISRTRSKESLQAFRQVAIDYAELFKSAKRKNTMVGKSVSKNFSSGQAKKKTLSSLSKNLQMQVLKSNELLKMLSLEENKIYVKTTEGEVQIINLKGDDNLFSGPDQKFLDYLLEHGNSGIQFKQDKLAILAKKAGFQLLPSDYLLDVHQLSQMPETLSSLSEMTSDRSEKGLINFERMENIKAEELTKELQDVVDNIEKTQISGTENGAAIEDEENVARFGNADINLRIESYVSMEEEHETMQECSATDGKKQCKSKASTVEARDNNYHTKVVPEGTDSGDQVLFSKEITNQDSVAEEYAHKTHRDNQNYIWSETVSGELNNEGATTYTGDNVLLGNDSEESETLGNMQDGDNDDGILFFYSEGGDRLREILRSDATIPSVVLIDPVEKKHYGFPKDVFVTYSSLFDFINAFLIGTLTAFRQSEPSPTRTGEPPRPPFVNRDFHEVDSTPHVTVGTFSSLILGFEDCNETVETSCAKSHNPGVAWGKDVLVIFSNEWCGFCKRLELVVREIYRLFKHSASLLYVDGEIAPNASAQNISSFSAEKNREKPVVDIFMDEATNGLPSIFQIDCTLNDCSSLLKSLNQKEIYPKLLLFPARKKDDPIAYEGDISVNKIIEFLAAYGSVSGNLYSLRGVFWNKMQQRTSCYTRTPWISSSVPIQIKAPPQTERPAQELGLSTSDQYGSRQIQTGSSDKYSSHSKMPAVGSVLISSEKLHGTYPFESSIIIIVKANPDEGFVGLIVNKPLSWDDLQKIDMHLESTLRNAPINFGGPIVAKGTPFLCLTRLSNIEGFKEVLPGIYYGGPVDTRKVNMMIMSGKISVYDLWFFLGFASWGWQQLLDELAAQAWHITAYRESLFHWPADKP